MVTAVSFKDALLDGAREVLETMAFMMVVEESGQDGPEIGELALLGSITFKGDLEGCLAICCGAACARTIAANMLGLNKSEELTQDGVCDALAELTNMVMGAIKSRVQSNIGVMEVSIPCVVRGRELNSSLGEGTQKVAIRVNIEEQYGAMLQLMYRDVPSRSRRQG
jgi:CheY-specific phosphatase CheX